MSDRRRRSRIIRLWFQPKISLVPAKGLGSDQKRLSSDHKRLGSDQNWLGSDLNSLAPARKKLAPAGNYGSKTLTAAMSVHTQQQISATFHLRPSIHERRFVALLARSNYGSSNHVLKNAQVEYKVFPVPPRPPPPPPRTNTGAVH